MNEDYKCSRQHLAVKDKCFVYPLDYDDFIEKFKKFEAQPWKLFCGRDLYERYKGLCERYPTKKYIPFMYRNDSDDIACFVSDQREQESLILVVHDFASSGWEVTDQSLLKFNDLEQWSNFLSKSKN